MVPPSAPKASSEFKPSTIIEESTGATVTASWVSPTAVDIRGDLPTTTSRWVGAWTFAYLDPSGAYPDAVPVSTVQLFPDIALRLESGASVLRGAPSTLVFRLTNADGSPPPPQPFPPVPGLAGP